MMSLSLTSLPDLASSMMVFAREHDGVLNVNKPQGWTSHDVVVSLRKLLGIQKIGHAGTLDPMATGVLPILIGKATKVAQYLLDWDKEYVAVLRLGQRTDTQDATGTIMAESSVDFLSDHHIRSVMAEFQGSIQQIPPMFSAVKVGGRPLYKLARKGLTVERSPRQIQVYRLEVLAIHGRDVHFRVVCSKGTYVRTLCSDIGDRLGVGGHLRSLERTRVGPLTLPHALDLKKVQNLFGAESLPQDSFLTLDDALHAFPSITVNDQDAQRVMHGSPVRWSNESRQVESCLNAMRDGQPVRLKDSVGHLLALGQVRLPDPTASIDAYLLSIVKVFWPN